MADEKPRRPFPSRPTFYPDPDEEPTGKLAAIAVRQNKEILDGLAALQGQMILFESEQKQLKSRVSDIDELRKESDRRAKQLWNEWLRGIVLVLVGALFSWVMKGH